VSWRALVLAGVDEPQVLPKLQQVLVSERHDATLFTTVCTVAIPPGGDAHVRLAGHPAPVVMHPPVQVEPLIGLPLGIAGHASWEAEPLVLHPGWALLLYTDGLIEGKGPVPDEPLWPEGLIRLLHDERDTPHDDLPARLVERAQVLNGGPLSDDVAILLLTADRT
jgi:serine phosphatase RsbU (regulator of sigma subunit)